jgi:uncharacterized membrane protein
MKTILWIVQIFLGVYFLGVGILHFAIAPGMPLPGPMTWMFDLSPTLHWITGVAEILGGLGLILPSVTRIMPKLTVYAAYALALVMVLAAGWHVLRGEWVNIVLVLLNAALLVWVGRMRSGPYRIPARGDIAGSM